MRILALVPASLAAAALAGCGGSQDSPPAPPPSAVGPGLSIEDALESDVTGPLLVNGYLLGDGGSIRLCTALAESYPPQCGEPSLDVVGSKLLEQRQLFKTGGGITWSEEPVQLLGVVEDGTITVSENAEA